MISPPLVRRTVLAGLLGAGLAGCGAGGRLDGLARGERGKVAEVRTGETVVLDSGLAVRLTGVEAPNFPEPLAREAEVMLSDLLSGEKVSLFYGGARRDRYDRAIAHIRRDRDRLWVQEALLRAGLARVHTWPDNRALAKALLGFEAHAREKGRGLWALPGHGVLLPHEAVRQRGFLIVEGRVKAVVPDDRGSRLVFTTGGVEPLVTRSALPSADLRGRIVRVRGWSGAGDLRIDHPEAVELIRE